MSIKNLFDNNRQAITVSKYLKKTNVASLGDGIESRQHLSQSIEKRDRFVPPVNYNNPKDFVHFGSAEKYYDNAFSYTTNYYPYDGSDTEITAYGNDLNPLEYSVFKEFYPRSTGYINLGVSYGSVTSDATGYYSSSNAEYIETKGGPHSGTIYSESSYRTSNLEFGGPSGSTVEFFFNKGTGIPSTGQSEKQVVLDVWNNVVSSSQDYGRLRIEIFSGSEDRFKVTMMSGTQGFFTQSVPTTGGIAAQLVSGSWHNYSFAFHTSDNEPSIDFYIDGVCWETNITASGHQAGLVGVVTGSLISNIGALRTAPSGTKDVSDSSLFGYGKLSASIDEFRFWKKARTPEDIGQYWFTPVYGGSNRTDANRALGVYYKFNEGITLTSSIDDIILDYSGRLSNGFFAGYSSVTSRNTGSALNIMSLVSKREDGDPIVRASNPVLVSEKTSFVDLGRQYDYTNSSYLMNMVPSWIYEEDENTSGEMGNLTQILGSYLDTLNLQISQLSKIKDIEYISGSLTGSLNEFPYNNRLLSNAGLVVPEIFEDIGVFGQLLERDEQINFDQELSKVKNAIYKNIYNNLNFIFKSKGNEKSIRNLIRCYGIDENILDVSVYSNNETYRLDSKYLASVSNKKYIDFTGLRNAESSEATVYQYYNGDTNSYGIITGSSELEYYAFTLEGEFIFPNKQNSRLLNYVPPQVISSSLMGFHTPLSTDPDTVDTTWATIGDLTYSDQGFQLYAVKSPGEYAEVLSPDFLVKDAFFVLKDSSGNTLLTTDIYQNVYDGQKWNFALSLNNEKYPFADQVDGTEIDSSTKYRLNLYGVNYDTGIKRNSFTKSVLLDAPSGSQTLQFPKKIYTGAHRTNFSGAVLAQSDVRASSIRYWSQLLPTGTIDIHSRDVDNYGHLSPYQQAYSFQNSSIPQVYIPNIETLALNWDFTNLENPDSAGRVTVADFSSGSNASGYMENYQGTVFSNVNKRQLTGRGEYFLTGSSVAVKSYPYTEKQQLPEYVLSRDMVDIRATDIEVFRQNQQVNNLYFSVEKSPYKSISKRMLQFFASLSEMNNLIGEPANSYRPHYKNMEKLREVFFRRVGNVPDFDKYAEYYKWVDAAMGQIVTQLFPASSKHTVGSRTLVENHLLERPKYHWHFLGDRRKHKPDGPDETKKRRIFETAFKCEERPGWRFSHAPLGLAQNENCDWWKFRANRDLPSFGVTDAGVINTRQAIFSSSFNNRPLPTYPIAPGEVVFEAGQEVLCLSADLNPLKVGGINQYLNKKRDIRTLSFDSFQPIEDCTDVLNPFAKTRINFRGTVDSRNFKGEQVTPFGAFSSSLSADTSGYGAQLNSMGLVNIDLANLHEDSIVPMGHSVPMQGPFTNTQVGGYQSRHVAPLRTFRRKEKYLLNIASGTGSMQIYVTQTNTSTENSTPKGHYLRGLSAKSPVNIANIVTTTGSSEIGAGVNVLGNYSKNYQVVQTVGRDRNNMDFVFNNENYNNGTELGFTGSMASAFIIPPPRRIGLGVPGDGAEGLSFAYSGSADYAAPRQISSRRISKTIFVNHFASPGSILDSKQQYRDVPSDQYAANNALPYRNQLVRKLGNLSYRFYGAGLGDGAGLNGYLRLYTGWGGFQQDITPELDAVAGNLSLLNSGQPFTIPIATSVASASISNIPSGSMVALHKTQRNTIQRVQISGTSPVVTYYTASVRDNGFVGRPVPDADRSQWFNNLTGSNSEASTLYSQYILSSSRYPEDISLITSSLSAQEISSFGALSVVSNNAGNTDFVWGGQFDVVPWSQLRHGQTNQGLYFNKNNVYNIIPRSSLYAQNTSRDLISSSYTRETRAGSSVLYPYYRRFREPPVTSKYKPLIHKLKAYPGSPEKTLRARIDIELSYAYGNELQAFANKTLNTYVNPPTSTKHVSHKEKRPYEIFRNNFIEGLPKSVTGIDFFQQMLYSETVYPREIYTYMSASRGRLAFYNNFWKNDKSPVSNNMGSFTSYYQLRDYDAHSAGPTFNIPGYNRQITRVTGNFHTSQGYAVLALDQVPWNPSVGASEPAGFGSASIWPMDSFLYSDSVSTLKTVLTASVPILLADASTMAAGELMMLNFGTVEDGITDSLATTSSGSWTRNNSVTSQYVYSVPGLATGSENVVTPAVPATCSVTMTGFLASFLDPVGSGDPTSTPPPLSVKVYDNSLNFITFWFDGGKPPAGPSRIDATNYRAGINGASGVYDVAHGLYNSIAFAKTNAELLVTAVAPTSPSGLVTIVADNPGAAINTTAVGGTAIGSQATQVAYAGGVNAVTTAHITKDLPDALCPGGALSRPAWTAGSQRKYIDGISKGANAPQQYPFYNSYEDYAQDVRLAGQEYTIVPEFRISEVLPTYQSRGDLRSLVKSTLTLTGSSQDNYSAESNSDFIPRYATTDLIQYLSPFMEEGSRDLEFNKNPRQLGLKSEAILKLLPYDGFYPMDRTLQIATLFSQSYSPASAANWGGTSGSSAQRWRALHRPFFAPGVIYNSIKSGMGVEYPIWRAGRNHGEFRETSGYTVLAGALSGALPSGATIGQIPGNRRRRNDDGADNFNFSTSGVDSFFWSEKLPFEAILKPLEYISDQKKGILLSDLSPYLINDITGSISTTGSVDDTLYRLSISNFLATVPEFFLKKQEDNTNMTKFVAQVPTLSKEPPQGTAPENTTQARTVLVKGQTAYVMEIGLKKTDNFNLYNNPYAFGSPTSSGSVDWQTITAAGADIATRTQVGSIPEGKPWPLHRGEFAPFTPPYYYGPSLVRIIYMPKQDKEVTLSEILYGHETYTEFVNENGQYFDFASGSFKIEDGSTIETSDYPPYQWNRSWQNRMDLDASIIIDNIFPTELGNLSPLDQNKWVIMPKWECPALDFSSSAGTYDFSSSINPASFETETLGMWHQYGVEPRTNEGVYLYLSDVNENSLEYRLVGNPAGSEYPGSFASVTSYVQKVKKIPKFVFDAGVNNFESLAKLVGFREDDIMPPGQWVPERAKRMGQLAEDNEKTISEAVLAMPFWYDTKTEEYVCMTMTADATQLGPKIKEFRRAFTKYSLPPALKDSIASMIPTDYPEVSRTILPFGPDDYESSFNDYSVARTPIIYLFEHTATLTKQDLGDIWQGVMPDLAKYLKKTVTSIDHYMPGEQIEQTQTVFPEILQTQLDLGVAQTGHPRVDLIDVTGSPSGFQREIRWLVFKVKQRGPTSYYETIFNEINTGKGSRSFQNLFGYISADPGISPALREAIERQKNVYTESLYNAQDLGQERNTYNWPYDYCSLIEMTKLTAKTGFRPQLETETREYQSGSI